MTIQLQFLGLPRVCIDGRVTVLLWQRQTLKLLTYLFTATGPQARDDVAFAIWPDEEEEAARTLLRRNLNQLRSTLSAPVAHRLNAAARAAGDRLAEAASALTYAAAYHTTAANSNALRDLDRAAEIYAAAGASRELRTVQLNRSSTLADRGRPPESIAVFRARYNNSKAANSDEDVFFAASGLVGALLGTGAVDEALVLAHEALALARALGGDLYAAMALGTFGEAEIAAGAEGDAGDDRLVA